MTDESEVTLGHDFEKNHVFERNWKKGKPCVFFQKKIEWPVIRKRSLPERNGA